MNGDTGHLLMLFQLPGSVTFNKLSHNNVLNSQHLRIPQ